MRRRVGRSGASWGLVLVLIGALGAGAQQERFVPVADSARPVPQDTAILELDAPAGAAVTINGTRYGTQRHRFEFKPFAEGTYGRYEVVVRFPDGRQRSRSVFLRGGWHVRLPLHDGEASRPQLVLQTGHTGRVNEASFSPDGRRVVTASQDSTAIVWDASTGQRRLTLQGHTESVNSARFSPDSRWVITASSDGSAIIWDAATGQKRLTLPDLTEVVSASFSPDGLRVVTAISEALDNRAVIWDARSGRELVTLRGHQSWLRSAAFSPDGRRVVTAAEDQKAIVWDAGTGRQLVTIRHASRLGSASFSPDGLRLLTTASEKTAMIWDAATGRKLLTLQGHTGQVGSASFSPDGRRVITTSWDKTAIVWDAFTGQPLTTLKGHDALVVGPASFSPDGRRVVLGADASRAILWDVASGQEPITFQGHTGSVSSASFSADGRRIVTSSWDKTAIVWDTTSGKRLLTLGEHPSGVRSAAISPDGRRIVTAWTNGAFVWDAETGRKVATLRGHGREVNGAAISPDGRRVATASDDQTAIVWDAETGRKVATLRGHDHSVTSVSFSPDGHRVLTACWFDKSAIIWDAETGERQVTLPRHDGGVRWAAFSPDGRRVVGASGWNDNTALIWDVAASQTLATLQAHTNNLNTAAFSPDGRRIITSSDDGTAIVWDAATGRQQLALRGHDASVHTAAFSPDGRQVITSSQDGTTRLWDAATSDELARLVTIDAGRAWLVVTPQGFFDGSEGGRQLVNYRVGETVTPVDRFFQDFYHPGLLTEIMTGRRPTPTASLGESRPPNVRIVEPKQGGEVEQGKVTLVVEVENQGGGIQGPWLFQNGAKVSEPGSTSRDGDRMRRRYEVDLVEGENRLEVKAASGDGSWESEPAVITLKYAKSKSPQPHLYLLAVGVSKYAQEGFNLKFAAADAADLAGLFQRRAQMLYGGNVHITTLTDGQATGAAIRAALKELTETAGKADTIVVFLSGHGTMVGQRYYFIPHDMATRPGVATEDDIRKGGVPADVLVDLLTAGKALKRMLILDTCASGGTSDLFQIVATRNPLSFQKEVERLSRQSGVYVLAASAAREAAAEDDTLKHGALTYALLAGVKAISFGPLEGMAIQPASGRVVDVFEWFSYAAGHVPRLVKGQNVNMGGRGESFPVLPISEEP